MNVSEMWDFMLVRHYKISLKLDMFLAVSNLKEFSNITSSVNPYWVIPKNIHTIQWSASWNYNGERDWNSEGTWE